MAIVEAATIDYSGLPEWAQAGMQRYFEQAIPPGSALRAALENDLQRWVALAYFAGHEEFARDTGAVVRWLFNELPSPAWGSHERVASWLASADDEALP